MAQSAGLQELSDRQAIHDVLMRYSRAIDRRDWALLETVYWPDAIDDHGDFRGTLQEFLHLLNTAMGTMRITSHFLGNLLIEFSGPDTAQSETYFQAFHQIDMPGGLQDWQLGGRYLDKFARRDGEWRIAHRFLAIDYQRSMAATAIQPGFTPRPDAVGQAGPGDPLYLFFGKARGT